MKRSAIIIFILSLLYVQDSKAQFVILDRSMLLETLQSRYPGCITILNSTQVRMDTTCPAIRTEDSLWLFTMGGSLNGLQYFPSVVYLDVSNGTSPGGGWSIDEYVWPPNLKYLDCSSSAAYPLTFPPFPASLETLICNNNHAGGITSFPPSLKYMDLSYNFFSQLPALPNGLEKMICEYQGETETFLATLTSLPALPPSLRYLNVRGCALSSLPALPASLDTLICGGQYIYDANGIVQPTLSNLPALPANLIINSPVCLTCQ